MKVLLNLIATNRYMGFLPNILESVNTHFFPSAERHVIVHTNLDLPELNYPSLVVEKHAIPHEQWPIVTLKRFHYFLGVEDRLKESDYCFYMDVDAVFIKTLDWALPYRGIFGTIHPIYYSGPGTPERDPISTAYIPEGSDSRYYYGGFFGGRSEDFIKMSHDIRDCVDIDMTRNYIAAWHDESQFNRYLFQNPPSLTFEFPFGTAEGISKIVPDSYIHFLDKNAIGGHNYFRGIEQS
jgi:histo-blood group ABO system transferase